MSLMKGQSGKNKKDRQTLLESVNSKLSLAKKKKTGSSKSGQNKKKQETDKEFDNHSVSYINSDDLM